MVGCARRLRYRCNHPSGPCRTARGGGTVHIARMLVMPADKLLGELAKDPSVIALSMPIDYWDYLGWKDTLADARFSARQKAYSQMRGDRDVYTPQVAVSYTHLALPTKRIV